MIGSVPSILGTAADPSGELIAIVGRVFNWIFGNIPMLLVILGVLAPLLGRIAKSFVATRAAMRASVANEWLATVSTPPVRARGTAAAGGLSAPPDIQGIRERARQRSRPAARSAAQGAPTASTERVTEPVYGDSGGSARAVERTRAGKVLRRAIVLGDLMSRPVSLRT
ncbi:MAG: hypothetical protein O2819_07835 [Planctomycetota bacterium]|nr:hypothetical protein [Planctomycetota bacterium]